MQSRKALLSVAIFLTALSVTNVGKTSEINIASASNFGGTLQALVDTFTKATLVDRKNFNIILASTGKHTAQINRGAPIDIFLSADLIGSNLHPSLTVSESEFTYAIGVLSLVSRHALSNLPFDNPPRDKQARSKPDRDTLSKPIAQPELSQSIDCLAIANPRVAPYGQAGLIAAESLKHSGIRVKRLVQGQSIAQAFQFFHTGACNSAFVAKAQVISLLHEKNDTFNSVDVPQSFHQPIQQNAILLKRAADKVIALKFLEYLKSDEARKIIRAAGYLTDIQ